MDNNSKDDEVTAAAEILLSMNLDDSMPPETQENVNDDDAVAQPPQETQGRNAYAVAAPPSPTLPKINREKKVQFVPPPFPNVERYIAGCWPRRMEKQLQESDVMGNRLALRRKNFEQSNFHLALQEFHTAAELGHGIEMKVFDTTGRDYNVTFKNSDSYLLLGDGWRDFVRDNNFQDQINNFIIVWLFIDRPDHRLCFLVALSKPRVLTKDIHQSRSYFDKFIDKKKKKKDDDDDDDGGGGGGGGGGGYQTRSAAALAIRG